MCCVLPLRTRHLYRRCLIESLQHPALVSLQQQRRCCHSALYCQSLNTRSSHTVEASCYYKRFQVPCSVLRSRHVFILSRTLGLRQPSQFVVGKTVEKGFCHPSCIPVVVFPPAPGLILVVCLFLLFLLAVF